MRSTLVGVAGVFTHEVGIEVDHAFRTWLDATLKFTGDRDTYVGQSRQDDRYAGALVLHLQAEPGNTAQGGVRRDRRPPPAYQQLPGLCGAAGRAAAALITLVGERASPWRTFDVAVAGAGCARRAMPPITPTPKT